MKLFTYIVAVCVFFTATVAAFPTRFPSDLVERRKDRVTDQSFRLRKLREEQSESGFDLGFAARRIVHASNSPKRAWIDQVAAFLDIPTHEVLARVSEYIDNGDDAAEALAKTIPAETQIGQRHADHTRPMSFPERRMRESERRRRS